MWNQEGERSPRFAQGISADHARRRGEILRESAKSAGYMGYMFGSVSSFFHCAKLQNNLLCVLIGCKKHKKLQHVWKKCDNDRNGYERPAANTSECFLP